MPAKKKSTRISPNPLLQHEFNAQVKAEAKKAKSAVDKHPPIWHTSDAHMKFGHLWTQADCDHIKARTVARHHSAPLVETIRAENQKIRDDNAARRSALIKVIDEELKAISPGGASFATYKAFGISDAEIRIMQNELNETLRQHGVNATDRDAAAKDSDKAFLEAAELVNTYKKAAQAARNCEQEEEEAKTRMARETGPVECSPKGIRKAGPIKDQLEELGKALYVASELLGRLEGKLEPLRFVTPKPADEEKKPNERSILFNDLTNMTTRVNDLCRRLSWLEEDIEL